MARASRVISPTDEASNGQGFDRGARLRDETAYAAKVPRDSAAARADLPR